MKILITGAAGYIGAMLAREFMEQSGVEAILGVDREPEPLWLQKEALAEKLEWLQAEVSELVWQERAAAFAPDVVIHTAWQIRELFGRQETQWKWNVEGSRAVFDFAFATPSVRKLIHFSTATVYGAYSDNTFDHHFKEDEPLREDQYLYGVEKKKVEEILQGMHAKESNAPQVIVVRLASVTGPRGRYMMKGRFNLQAALSGKLSRSFTHRLITLMLSFMPGSRGWARQFIHEDDVANIVTNLALKEVTGKYEVFNLVPPGPIVTIRDMAKAVGKKVVMIPTFLIRLTFGFFWHLFRGRVPTSPWGWKLYVYPIMLDGSKVTRVLGYDYMYEPYEAFTKKEGRYMKYVNK